MPLNHTAVGIATTLDDDDVEDAPQAEQKGDNPLASLRDSAAQQARSVYAQDERSRHVTLRQKSLAISACKGTRPDDQL